MGQTMTTVDLLKALAALALLCFSFYMAHQNKDARVRKRWKSIIATIALLYFAAEAIEKFQLL
jgi:hypothetical protein